jgi:hypothetical protein
MKVQVDFCGEIYDIEPDQPLCIGRDGQLAIDDNPFLHRRFLEVSQRNSMVWLANVGSQLSATVSDDAGLVQAWLSPGAQLPLIFDRTSVRFTAGPTTYEFDIMVDESLYVPVTITTEEVGETTIGRMTFTPDQKLLIVVLCENVLRRSGRGAGTIPSSADAARRLGWTLTKFNRKLDNVCQKLSRSGIRGLHGDSERLATSRRARLVEYAMAARLVSNADLALLNRAAR